MGRFWILILVILFCGCKNYYITTDGSLRPKKAKFRLAKTAFQLNDRIDTNSVYISIKKKKWNNKIINDTTFIRFYANGRCFKGHNNLLENKFGYNDYNNYNNIFTDIGLYNLNNHKIEIEIANVSLGGARGNVCDYFIENGFIRNDTIFLYDQTKNEIKQSDINKHNSTFFTRRKIEGLTGTPDW